MMNQWILKSTMVLGLLSMTSQNLQAKQNPHPPYQNPLIEQIIEIESKTQYVSESMAVKKSGLRYVNHIYDFALLARSAFASPSDSYKDALGNFIVEHLANYVRRSRDIRIVLELEGRTRLVSHTMAVKKIGLTVVDDFRDFSRLAVRAFSNPSDSYKVALGEFITENVAKFIRDYTPIADILDIEGRTHQVTQSMAVKTAGLVAVKHPLDFWKLAEYAFSNPSDSYKQAVRNFISEHSDRYANP